MRDGEAVDPMRAAQANMRPAPVKRFYKAVEVREADGGCRADARRARRADAGQEPARRAKPRGHGEGRRGMGAAGGDARSLRHAGDPARSIPPSTASRRRWTRRGPRSSATPAPTSSATAPTSRSAFGAAASAFDPARLGRRGARRALRAGGGRDARRAAARDDRRVSRRDRDVRRSGGARGARASSRP